MVKGRRSGSRHARRSRSRLCVSVALRGHISQGSVALATGREVGLRLVAESARVRTNGKIRHEVRGDE
jgi:hypothetical protein